MRIIAGTLGGRQFNSPGTNRTHPMSDKMRGALFNILGDLDGLTVLDAFGGSGALALEAVSRGATKVIVIDNDRSAQRTIDDNIKLLDVSARIDLVKASANAWLTTNQSATFDIVLCDPPYDNPQPELLRSLAGSLEPGGIMVISYPTSLEPLHIADLEILKNQTYGDGQLIFYRRVIPAQAGIQ